MMDMYSGMMGGNLAGAGLLGWIMWILVVVLLIAAIRWLWKQGDK